MSTGQQVQVVSETNLRNLVLSNGAYQTILTNLIGRPTITLGSTIYYTVSQILGASPQNITIPNNVIELIPSPVNCCNIQTNNNVVTAVTNGNITNPVQTTSVIFPGDDLTYLQFARPGLFNI